MRLVFMARVAFEAGYVSSSEAWEIGARTARRLQKAHRSWSEMGDAFLLGLQYWQVARGVEPAGGPHLEVVRWAQEDRVSPWNELQWSTSLEYDEETDGSLTGAPGAELKRKLWLARAAILSLLVVPAIFRNERVRASIGVDDWVVPVGLLAFMALAIVVVRRSWRCTACGSGLGLRWSPKACPHCGIPFDTARENRGEGSLASRAPARSEHEIVVEAARRRRAGRLPLALLIAGAVGFLGIGLAWERIEELQAGPYHVWGTAIAGVVIAIAAIWLFRLQRCPGCERYLGRYGWKSLHCQHCGAQLR
jgi:hypothetical protein